METLAFVLLVWFLFGGLFAAFVEHLVLRYSRPQRTRKSPPCIGIGCVTSLVRIILILWFCDTFLDCSPGDHSIKILIFADVLSTAIHAYFVVHRYGH